MFEKFQMMFLIFSYVSFAKLYLLINGDISFVTLAEKFGLPVAFAILTFLYFSSELKKRDKTESIYRKQLLDVQREQLEYLKHLVDKKLG